MPHTPHTHSEHGNLHSYQLGFVLSIGLTIAAFYIVTNHLFSTNGIIASIFGLAVVQLVVQLVFFLHLDKESKPRMNLMAFLFALMVVLIIVGGSLWVMYHMNYTMTPSEMNNYMVGQEGL